jgi:uncharacterized protein involved in exopolysaccharide biosynthesis
MQSPRIDVEQESADLFDYAQIRDYLLFAFGAVRRHKLITIAVFVLVVDLTAVALWALPRSYHVETKLLGQRNQVISSLAVPGRAMPGEADAPARAAGETIKSRESLLTLMKQTDLVNHFYQHRSRAGALKDWFLALVGRSPSDQDKLESVLGTLEQRLAVTLSTSWQGEGTVTIAVNWPDAVVAYHLVRAAQQNFLEARHVTELSNIAEAISILEGHAALYRQEVEVAAEELETVRAARGARTGRPQPARRARPRPVPNQELSQLRSMIDGKQRAINDLEQIRQRRQSELQARLAEQKAIYSEAHPVVVDILQSIRAGNVDSPQLTQLRKDLEQYKSEYARRGGPAEYLPALDPLPPEIARLEVEPRDEDSGEVYLKTYVLRQAVGKYSVLIERINSAKIELDTANAAFKYRYSVLRPAMLPTRPTKPNVPLVLIAGTIAALLVSLFAAVAVDIISGEIIERWQVERVLKLPVLAELYWP